MKKHRNSIKLGLLAAGIAASSLATAGNSDPIRNTPVVQNDRTPVVSLTPTMGDVGFEIFDGQTQRYSLSTLPKNAIDAIVYIDVDSIE